MPLGYQVGNQYRFDTKYDRYAQLDIWKLLHRIAGQRGYAAKVTFSHITRGYCAEAFEMVKLEKSGNWYMSNCSMKYASNPLEACIAAFRLCVPHDAYLAAIYLEAEAVLLGFALADARAREAADDKRAAVLHAKLHGILDGLALLLGQVPVSLVWREQSIGTAQISELRGKPYPASGWFGYDPEEEGEIVLPVVKRKRTVKLFDEDDDL